jgi:hypothetical protein
VPALPADIAAGTRAAEIETWSDSAIQTRYASARDGSEQPADGFFDDASNAVTALAQRGALIGTERRRFKVAIDGAWFPDPKTGIPTVTLIDPEQGVSADALVSRIEVNLENEATIFEVMV